ncbi:MAG: YSIRK-type signal peptide-containing protein [Lactobacillus crispatus]|jgi:LPXTG-motif cell wall-anchored protein|nr:YSIRK-type signal peptide-containing protein [Lactobacillus crispatus]MCI1335201.1 YSIRK-type signal peptide-containing protein [Lactobacillus crispatus]MCI1364615.1 YSIRK-type signal peptide-containing protein [Lactobacillus crispatus]MCI1493394.1 YSIRK-type signal peptide-containing protein [Lactobacillus crispatus]MCI1523663.1 YSIRK-type signal peptide-containing protein [Lactobacillus crispatus]
MLSKNNFQEHLRKMNEKKERFSIRKFTVGAASVLIGFTIFGMANGATVKADTADAQTTETLRALGQQTRGDQTAAQDNNKPSTATSPTSAITQGSDKKKQASTDTTPITQRPTVEPTNNQADTNNTTKHEVRTKAQQSPAAAKSTAPKQYTDTAEEEIFVYGPAAAQDSSNGYYKTVEKKNMTGVKSAGGGIAWGEAGFSSKNIDTLLKSGNFTYTATGKRGQDIPYQTWLDQGYVPVITQVMTEHTEGMASKEKATKLRDELDEIVSKNRLISDLPAYSISQPISTTYRIDFYKAIRDYQTERVNIYLPGHDKTDGSAEYSAVVARKDFTGYQDDQGNKVWTSVKFDSLNLADLFKNAKFYNNKTGYPEKLPDLSNYFPEITSAETAFNSTDKAQATALFQKLNQEIKQDPTSQALPEYTATAPVGTIFNIHFNEWQKTGQTKTFTRTVRTWYQYYLNDKEVYTYTYRQGKNSQVLPIQEQVIKLSFDEYKNKQGQTEWRINKDASSAMSDLTAGIVIPYVEGYNFGIRRTYGKDIVSDAAFEDALAVNNGKEDGKEITKLVGQSYVPEKGNEAAWKKFNNGTEITNPGLIDSSAAFSKTPDLFGNGQSNEMIDIVYYANLHKVTEKIIDQDVNDVLYDSAKAPNEALWVPSDWTWFDQAPLKLPKGYHEGTKQGNPVPYLNFKTGQFVVNGKVVTGVQLQMGTQDINYVYYVQKDATPTPKPESQPTPQPQPTPEVQPETSVKPEQPATPTNDGKQNNGPVLPEKVVHHDGQEKHEGQNKQQTNVKNVIPHATAVKKSTHKVSQVENKADNQIKSTAVVSTNAKKTETLPQTGEESKSSLGIAGLVLATLATLAGLLGFAGTDKKRKN